MSSHGFLLAAYAPGSSLIHRAPLWLKFLLVVGCGMASFLIADWAVSAAVLALLCGLFLLSGAGPARLFRAVRPVLPVLAGDRSLPVVAAGRTDRRADRTERPDLRCRGFNPDRHHPGAGAP